LTGFLTGFWDLGSAAAIYDMLIVIRSRILYERVLTSPNRLLLAQMPEPQCYTETLQKAKGVIESQRSRGNNMAISFLCLFKPHIPSYCPRIWAFLRACVGASVFKSEDQRLLVDLPHCPISLIKSHLPFHSTPIGHALWYNTKTGQGLFTRVSLKSDFFSGSKSSQTSPDFGV
jgi:hypothetical protein